MIIYAENISSPCQIWQQQLGPTNVCPDLPPPESRQRGRGGERPHSTPERKILLAGSSFLQPALVFLSQFYPPWGNAIHFAGPLGWADQSLPIWGGQAGMVRNLLKLQRSFYNLMSFLVTLRMFECFMYACIFVQIRSLCKVGEIPIILFIPFRW